MRRLVRIWKLGIVRAETLLHESFALLAFLPRRLLVAVLHLQLLRRQLCGFLGLEALAHEVLSLGSLQRLFLRLLITGGHLRLLRGERAIRRRQTARP